MKLTSSNFEEELIDIISKNQLILNVFELAKQLNLQHYYIGAGCLVQAVWNYLLDKPLNYGIDDIDIVYFDNDLSYQTEDRIIKNAQEIFKDIPIKVDIKNQARVHLWYKDRFGKELIPYKTIEEAIDSWPTTATSLGIRSDGFDNWKIYAPYGLHDLFQLVIKANKKLITEEVYLNKAQKWKKKWPELRIITWEE